MLTPDAANRLLALYEAMAQAARDNDWERLDSLGAQAVSVRDAAAADRASPAALAAQAQQDLAATIRRILELESEIRTHAEPALDSTRKLLSSSVRDRNVRNAYGNARF